MKLSVFLSCYTDTSDICPLVEQCHLIEYCPVLPPSRSKKTATELTMYFTQSPQNKTAPERRHIGPITTSEHCHPAYLEPGKSSSGLVQRPPKSSPRTVNPTFGKPDFCCRTVTISNFITCINFYFLRNIYLRERSVR